MLEQRGDAALAQEPLAEPGVGGDGRVEHLQRHRAPLGIARQVDGPGGALAQQRLDPVSGDLRARRERVRHGHRDRIRARRAPEGLRLTVELGVGSRRGVDLAPHLRHRA